jgi:hypothetical protein
MTPASLAIIEAAFQPGDRTRAIGTWAGFSGVSSAIAPFLGGWLPGSRQLATDLPDQRPGRRGGRVDDAAPRPRIPGHVVSGSADWPGALAGVAALATITYAILVLPGGGIRSPGFAAAAVLALLSSAPSPSPNGAGAIPCSRRRSSGRRSGTTPDGTAPDHVPDGPHESGTYQRNSPQSMYGCDAGRPTTPGQLVRRSCRRRSYPQICAPRCLSALPLLSTRIRLISRAFT